MSLLTTQRIISNGLAQLRFEEVWPAIRPCAPEESVIQGLSAPKLLELRQLVRQLMLEQGRKVVIFSQWRRMLTLAHWAVSDLLAENGLRAGFFTGAEGQRRRTQNIVEFHDDPDHRLLFASDAGGVGLNLQHAANCVINLELPWNPAVLEQRIGRIYRIGQKQPIDVYNLVCEVGIESRIAGLVGTKQAFFKGLFDGESDAVQFEHSGSFLSKVEKIIEESMPTSDFDPEGQEDDPSEFADLISDDEVGDPFEELVDAADESQDQAEARPSPSSSRRTTHPPSSSRTGRSPGRPESPGDVDDRGGPPALLPAPDPSRSRRQGHHRGPPGGGIHPRRPVRRDGRLAPIDDDIAGAGSSRLSDVGWVATSLRHQVTAQFARFKVMNIPDIIRSLPAPLRRHKVVKALTFISPGVSTSDHHVQRRRHVLRRPAGGERPCGHDHGARS